VSEPLTVGILSSSLPTPCGIATFTRALGSALKRQGVTVGVVRVLDRPEATEAQGLPVMGELVASDASTVPLVIDTLNACDVVIIQHEFGLYGGPDGEDVVRVMAGLDVPTIAIMHTVLPHPSPHQLQVANEVLGLANDIVVMTEAADQILRRTYDVDPDHVWLIPHGATVIGANSRRANNVRPRVLTWGLIGPGKGIERVLDAFMDLNDLDPPPLYVVAGRTHPKVLAHSGDVYRESLMARAEVNQVREHVIFDDSYRSLESLELLIASADVVVLPYDTTEQATSGVLVDAIAAGRPVIATAFPHAIELLKSGAGIVVPHHDVAALSEALRSVLTSEETAERMAAEARRIAPSLSWDVVASQYLEILAPLSEEVATTS
jgi:polysaccharide biosynthesis protein PslF